MITLRPGKSFKASKRLRERLIKDERKTAVKETRKERRTIFKISLSKEETNLVNLAKFSIR